MFCVSELARFSGDGNYKLTPRMPIPGVDDRSVCDSRSDGTLLFEVYRLNGTSLTHRNPRLVRR